MTPIGVLPTKWLVFSKTVLKPAAVRPGARIAIVSPASPFSREQFDRGVDELRRLGYEPAYDDDVFARTGKARLVLVTCGGPFDQRSGHYKDNIVVTAVPL